MVFLRRLISGFRRLLNQRQMEQELNTEVQAYFETVVDQKMTTGLSREAALRAAKLEMGGSLEALKDGARDVGWESSVETLWRDAGFAVRRLRKSPGFTLAAVVTLALGIGGNTVIFSVLNATSLASSAYPDPDRIALIWSTPPGRPDATEGARLVEYSAWRERTQAFDHVGTLLNWSSTLGSMRDGEPADRLAGYRFSVEVFRALGVKPVLGRLFTDEDDRTDGPSNVAVISYRLWQRRFDGETAVLGRTLLLDGTATTIIGVLPANFRFFDGGQSDFWIPMNFTRFQLQSRGANRVLVVVGHLKSGVSMEQARGDIQSIGAQLANEDPERQQGRGFRVQPLDDALMGNVRQLLGILQGAVGFVLLIACANVAGLLLIRAASQQKEVAIRLSLGASRMRIVGQFLTESLVLAGAGGLLGVGFAWGGVTLLVASRPSWLSIVQDIHLSAGVLAFSTVVSVLTGFAFGMVPALQVSTVDLVGRLKQSTSGIATGRSGHRGIQSTLVAGQVALTVILLVGAGLLIKSFWSLQRQSLGFEPQGVLSFQTRLPANQYLKQVSSQNGITMLDISPVPSMIFDRVAERLRQVPGVQSVAGTSLLPVPMGALQAPFTIEGRATTDAAGKPETLTAAYALVTPKFFGTMRIPVLRGRDFEAGDIAGDLPVAIINQEMARRWWPNDDPIGKHLTVAIVPGEAPREIIAVVGNTPVSRFDRNATPALYVPQLQESARYRTPFGQSRVQMSFVLRLTQPLDAVVPAVRRAVADVDPRLPLSQVQMVNDYLAQQVEVPRDSMLVVGAFGVMALVLAAFGIYGIVAYGVMQRTYEIGIRMALGAKRSQVLGLVLRQSTIFTVAGMIAGLAGAAALTRFVRTLLFGLTPFDPLTFVAVAVLFLLMAMIASYIPARRATKIDPLVALRAD